MALASWFLDFLDHIPVDLLHCMIQDMCLHSHYKQSLALLIQSTMFSSGTPAPPERRTRGGTVRRSQSRAGSIAGLAAGSEAGITPSSSRTGLRTRALPPRASSSRRQSLLPAGRTPSRAGSRLGSVALFDEDSVDGKDASNLLQADTEQIDNAGVLLKSDTHSVSILGGTLRAHLPAEVLDVLANSDFYSDPHAATLDVNAGYACLAGRTQCYVWSIARISEDEIAAPVSNFSLPARHSVR